MALLGIYTMMACCSFFSIVFKHTLADIISRACAPLEPVSLFNSITGSIWGKPTGNYGGSGMHVYLRISIIFIYLGHIFISNAYEDKEKVTDMQQF